MGPSQVHLTSSWGSFDQKIEKNQQIFQKNNFILDLVQLTGGVFGVADHEFHGPRAVGEAENGLYGGPRGEIARGVRVIRGRPIIEAHRVPTKPDEFIMFARIGA